MFFAKKNKIKLAEYIHSYLQFRLDTYDKISAIDVKVAMSDFENGVLDNKEYKIEVRLIETPPIPLDSTILSPKGSLSFHGVI